MSKDVENQDTDRSLDFDEALKGFDFDFDDDGEITLSRREEETEADDVSEDAEAPEEGEESEEEAKVVDGADKTSTLETQLAAALEANKRLEQRFNDFMAGKVQKDETALADDDDEDEVNEEDFADALSNPKSAKKVLKGIFKEMLSEAIASEGPLKEVTQEQELKRELSDAVMKYGASNFRERLPEIQEILNTLPHLTFSQVYELTEVSRKSANKSKATAKSDEVEAEENPEKQNRVKAKDLKERARKLQTETGVSGTTRERGTAQTVKDAFLQALEEG